MRLDLWLAQPKTGQGLRAALRVGAVLSGLWTLLAVYGLWSARVGLAAEASRLTETRRRVTDLAQTQRERRRQAERILSVRTGAPDDLGSADLASELAKAARESGVTMLSTKIDAKARATPPPDDQAARSTGGTPATSWTQAPVECAVAGTFSEITAFLERLASLPRVVEVEGGQLTRAGFEPGRNGVVLHWKFTGAVLGLRTQ